MLIAFVCTSKFAKFRNFLWDYHWKMDHILQVLIIATIKFIESYLLNILKKGQRRIYNWKIILAYIVEIVIFVLTVFPKLYMKALEMQFRCWETDPSYCKFIYMLLLLLILPSLLQLYFIIVKTEYMNNGLEISNKLLTPLKL